MIRGDYWACSIVFWRISTYLKFSTISFYFFVHLFEFGVIFLYSFPTKARLNRHMQTHNREIKLYCDLCDYQTFAPYALSDHRKIHHAEKRFKCEFCGEKFALNKSLIVRMRWLSLYQLFISNNLQMCSSWLKSIVFYFIFVETSNYSYRRKAICMRKAICKYKET